MKKIFNALQIKKIDNCTINNQSISSVELMESAAISIYEALIKVLKSKQKIVVFAGTGNNGGDALAVARMLLNDDYKLKVYLVGSRDNLSKDCLINKERLERLITIHSIDNDVDIPHLSPDIVVIDGLFGSGLNRPLEGVHKNIVEAVNQSGALVYSVDMPSGLYVGDNTSNDPESIIHADCVFTLQFPKLSLLLPQIYDYCRKMIVLDIGLCEKCIDEEQTDFYFLEKSDISKLLKSRSTFSHKGNFGHALLVAGSYGKMGAAVLAARACLRAGVGLLTMHIPQCGVDIMQTSVPEAMVDVDLGIESLKGLDNLDLDKYVIGVGPGIGQKEGTCDFLSSLLNAYHKPMVLDADALNLIASDECLKEKIPSGSILTPHPIEFERLIGFKCENSYHRLEAARNFAEKYRVYIVLKGAYSAIITPQKEVYFNSTGNPGMATGGSGDVLTGVITSLLAQGYSPLNSVLVGVYLHGLAGDLGVRAKSERSLLPSDIIEYLGRSYRVLENN